MATSRGGKDTGAVHSQRSHLQEKDTAPQDRGQDSSSRGGGEGGGHWGHTGAQAPRGNMPEAGGRPGLVILSFGQDEIWL